MNLTDVSPVLIDEAIRMEQIAMRLEQLSPAVRRRAGDEIALNETNSREFSRAPSKGSTSHPARSRSPGWSRHGVDSMAALADPLESTSAS